jgi:hypothetical protein
MSRSITISYDLHPPASTSLSTTPSTPKLTPSKSQQIPVEATHADGQDPTVFKTYYECLRGGISEAKSILGGDLTAWRDAVGSGEQFKESKRVVEDDAEGEDEE